MTEPTSRPGGEHTAPPNETPRPPATPPATSPPKDTRPTFQSAASEAADVAAQAVAQQVAATVAANQAAAMAAAEAAAAREAAEAAEAARAADAAEAARAADAALNASMAAGSAPEGSTTDASMQIASAPAEMHWTDPAPASTGSAPVPTDPALVPIDAAAIAESDPSMASAATVDAIPMAATAEAPVAATAEAAVAPIAVAAPVTEPKPSRRPMLVAWTRRLVILIVSVALLVAGVWLGSSTFQRTRTAPAAGGATVSTQQPADVAKEFIAALASGDSDAMRSSLSQQPNIDLTAEFTKFGIKKVTGVETLGTSVDGTRSATEVLLHTVNTDGNPFEINLIILVNGNQIEGFR
jgi:hypothetical protein